MRSICWYKGLKGNIETLIETAQQNFISKIYFPIEDVECLKKKNIESLIGAKLLKIANLSDQ